jgi:flagellar protein FliS
MYDDNLYQAYVEGDVVSRNPVGLVTALYEGAIQSVQQARRCLTGEDIWGRSKAISKAVDILTELIVSLDHDKAPDLSAQLKELYGYMQHRLLISHQQQDEAPMEEVEGLLATLLDGWYQVGEQLARQAAAEAEAAIAQRAPAASGHGYSGAYGFCEAPVGSGSAVYTF